MLKWFFKRFLSLRDLFKSWNFWYLVETAVTEIERDTKRYPTRVAKNTTETKPRSLLTLFKLGPRWTESNFSRQIVTETRRNYSFEPRRLGDFRVWDTSIGMERLGFERTSDRSRSQRSTTTHSRYRNTWILLTHLKTASYSMVWAGAKVRLATNRNWKMCSLDKFDRGLRYHTPSKVKSLHK